VLQLLQWTFLEATHAASGQEMENNMGRHFIAQ
jgi:hypothetical protein